MANFKAYIPILKKWEGGYVNDFMDSGGATQQGVTIATYIYYKQLKGLPKPSINDLKNITELEWEDVMKTLYWDKIMGDFISNQSLANLYCDWVINSGVGMIKKYQHILKVSQDGIFGKQSLAALNCHPDKEALFYEIRKKRLAFVQAIVNNRPSQNKFLKGWNNRIMSFKFEV